MIYSPYQVWKFHPDNQKSITWWVFHLKKEIAIRIMAGKQTKTTKSSWILYDCEDEDWNPLEQDNFPVTEDWIQVELDELKEVWREQFGDARFSMADIAEKNPMVWVFNSRCDVNPRGKPTFSNYEASKLDTIILDDDRYKKETEELAGPSLFKSGGLFWIFRLDTQIEFEREDNFKFKDDWLVYNFNRGGWENLDEKLKKRVNNQTCQRISYDTLFSEWEKFFEKLANKPNYINLEDIAEDTS